MKKSSVKSVRQRCGAPVGDQVARPVMDTPQGPRPVFPATSRETHYSPAAASRAAQRFISLQAYSCHTLLPGNSNSCRSLTFNKEIRWPHVFTPPGMFSAGKPFSVCSCMWSGAKASHTGLCGMRRRVGFQTKDIFFVGGWLVISL